MENKNNKIFVTGDTAIDTYRITASGETAAAYSIPGGAFLLADLIRAAGASEVMSPELLVNPENACFPKISGSEIFIKAITREGKPVNYVERVISHPGGKADFDDSTVKFPKSAKGCGVVVVDDAGAGFGERESLFLQDIADDAVVVYKMSGRITDGKCWRNICSNRSSGRKTVVIAGADDLRAMEEINISKSLSWEKTAMDLYYSMAMNENMSCLAKCDYLVVLFGCDGAMIYSGTSGEAPVLIYDPLRLEGVFEEENNAAVFGLLSVFTAAIAEQLNRSGIAGLLDCVKSGVQSARDFVEAGHDCTAGVTGILAGKIFSKKGKKPTDGHGKFCSAAINRKLKTEFQDSDYLTILDAKTKNTKILIAENLAVYGHAPGMDSVPEMKFGEKLSTCDRAEIEGYGSFRMRMREYMKDQAEQPLVLAVFGPPGSGKCNSIKVIAEYTCGGTAEVNVFEVPEMRETGDVIKAFYRVIDISKSGKMPVVIFDEFDSKSMEYLKIMVDSVKDGKFTDNGKVFSTGRSIFIFIGSLYPSLDEFVEKNGGVKERVMLEFKSCLQGFVNMAGLNPVIKDDGKGYADDRYLIRRARILRSDFEQCRKAEGLFSNGGKILNLDKGVLRAFLRVPEYKYGNRSIKSLINMSSFSGKKKFDKSALPSKDQLGLHVPAEDFMMLVEKETITGSKKSEDALVNSIAVKIHENYIMKRRQKNEPINLPEDFNLLKKEDKDSNVQAASDIARKLRSINMGVRLIADKDDVRTPVITEEELEKLACMEHNRWCAERKLQGWSYGTVRDNETKKHPNLKPYEELTEEIKEYDRESIRDIPKLIYSVGYEIYRMEEKEEIESDSMIKALARIIHSNYLAERKKEGQKPQSNPRLASYDDLPREFKNSNIDNAYHIPSKLAAIGYSIRYVKKGHTAVIPVFTEKEIEIMAKLEHTRWYWEKNISGWNYAPGRKDEEKKTTPFMVAYDKLDEKIKDYDRQTVKLIPELLAQIGYEAYKKS